MHDFRCSDPSQGVYFENDMYTAPAWLGVGFGIVTAALGLSLLYNNFRSIQHRITREIMGILEIPPARNNNFIRKFCRN